MIWVLPGRPGLTDGQAVMNRTLISILFAGGIFVGMVLLLELGWRIARRRQGKDEEGGRGWARSRARFSR